MTVLLLIAIALGRIYNTPTSQVLQEKIQTLPDLVQRVLSLESSVESALTKLQAKQMYYFIGYPEVAIFFYLTTYCLTNKDME